jgi:iron transport multicopper oxidase
MRIIGLMSQVPYLKVSIAGHDLTLLAVDGTEVSEVDVSSIVLHAGERYDFKLCANQKKGAYAITAEAPEFCDAEYLKRTGAPKPESCTFQAFLQYHNVLGSATIPKGPNAKGTGGGANPRKLTTPPLDLGSWKDFSLVKPLEAGPTIKPEADAFFQVNLGRLANGSMYLHTSNTPWKRPTTPLLMTKGLKCADGVPIVNVPEDATDIEVTIKNTLDDAHVVHLHGLQFQVIAMTENDIARHLVRLAGPESPVLKDTVSVPAQGTVTLRIIADNPGMWMLQDMSTTSQLRGAATVFNVLPSKQPAIPHGTPTQGPCKSDDFFV